MPANTTRSSVRLQSSTDLLQPSSAMRACVAWGARTLRRKDSPPKNKTAHTATIPPTLASARRRTGSRAPSGPVVAHRRLPTRSSRPAAPATNALKASTRTTTAAVAAGHTMARTATLISAIEAAAFQPGCESRAQRLS